MAKLRLKLPTPEEIHGNTSLIARVIGVLYATGAVLVTASLLLPHPSESNDAAILAIGAAGPAAPLLLPLPRLLRSWLLQVTMGVGSALISLSVYFAGQPGAYVAMF